MSVIRNSDTPFTRHNRFTTGSQIVKPVWQPCWTNRHCSFNRVKRTESIVKPGCTTGCIVYTNI